jgi:predicted short-subunit dehydrogenase-like oxidoreductase (DUF2520 family)
MALRVHVVGAGRAGVGIARLLAQADVEIGCVFARSAAAASLAAKRIGDGSATTSMAEALTDFAVTLVAVPENALARVADELANGPPRRESTALHVSGSLPGAVLAPLRRRGVAVGSMHPLASFADAERPPGSLRGVSFDVDGDPAARAVASELIRKLGARVLEVHEDGKALFHAAASLASNGFVALFDVAQQLAERSGAPAMAARVALTELARSTLENLGQLGAPHALTGPIERGQTEVVERHLAALRAAAPQLLDDYRTFARATLATALRKGTLDEAKRAALARLLEGA